MAKPGRGKASAKIVAAARDLRRRQTPMEAKLWQALRDCRLEQLEFRRQHPHGRFILDAFCLEHQLEVEINGPGHLEPKQAEYDAPRTEYLQLLGIRVLRFTNAEVEDNFEAVLRKIVDATKTSGKNERAG